MPSGPKISSIIHYSTLPVKVTGEVPGAILIVSHDENETGQTREHISRLHKQERSFDFG